jgi:hypothetical protein
MRSPQLPGKFSPSEQSSHSPHMPPLPPAQPLPTMHRFMQQPVESMTTNTAIGHSLIQHNSPL